MNGNYEALIKKIKRKQNIITVLTIVASVITIFACSPQKLVILDEVVAESDGNFVAMILIILLILIVAVFAMAFAMNPMTNSMIAECEPEKHLILNSALNKNKNLDNIFSVDYFYLGNFQVSLDFANKMILNKNPIISCIGLFGKARCEFFLKDFNSLKSTTEQYRAAVLKAKVNKKNADSLAKMQKLLDLLVAIADNDKKTVSKLLNIEPWNNSKSAQCFINYVIGLGETVINNKEEAIYRFKLTKEIGSKTCLFELADKNLLELREA